jgi:hypothetical protein
VVAAEGEPPLRRSDKRRGGVAVERFAEKSVVRGFGLRGVAVVRIVRRPGLSGEEAAKDGKGSFCGVGGFLKVVVRVTAVVWGQGS